MVHKIKENLRGENNSEKKAFAIFFSEQWLYYIGTTELNTFISSDKQYFNRNCSLHH